MTKLSCANSPENGVFGPMLCTLGGCRESRVSDTHAIKAHRHFVNLRPTLKVLTGYSVGSPRWGCQSRRQTAQDRASSSSSLLTTIMRMKVVIMLETWSPPSWGTRPAHTDCGAGSSQARQEGKLGEELFRSLITRWFKSSYLRWHPQP